MSQDSDNRDSFVIETPRLRLTLPPPGAAPRVALYFRENREHLAASSPFRPPEFFTVGHWQARLAENRREFEAGSALRLFLTATTEPDGPILGTCNFTNIVRGPLQACDLGYGLHHNVVGRGYMQEALISAIEYVFHEMRLHRIAANYRPGNERSARLLRRLGFTVEGYARDYLRIDGAWCDHVLTSLLNPEHAPER